MAHENLTWDQQQLAQLNAKLNTSHHAWEPILLTGYYAGSANQLGIRGGSPQHQLYLTTCSLDRELANAVRQLKGLARLEFYQQTVQPFDLAFTQLMCQLVGKDLLTKAPTKPLTEDAINRQLALIATFKRTVKVLPGIQGSLFLTFLAFLQQLEAWVQGKPYNALPLTKAIDQFVTANQTILGVRHGG